MERKSLWQIMVPCQWNDGKPIRTRHHREWDKRVRAVSGGLTIMAPGKGVWIDEGAVYEERMIPVQIMCDHKDIDEIAHITMQHYEQLAVLYYLVSDDCRLVHASPEMVAKFAHTNQVAVDKKSRIA